MAYKPILSQLKETLVSGSLKNSKISLIGRTITPLVANSYAVLKNDGSIEKKENIKFKFKTAEDIIGVLSNN